MLKPGLFFPVVFHWNHWINSSGFSGFESIPVVFDSSGLFFFQWFFGRPQTGPAPDSSDFWSAEGRRAINSSGLDQTQAVWKAARTQGKQLGKPLELENQEFGNR